LNISNLPISNAGQYLVVGQGRLLVHSLPFPRNEETCKKKFLLRKCNSERKR
jgi:hypothetical protein